MCADGTTTHTGVCQNPECIETATIIVIGRISWK